MATFWYDKALQSFLSGAINLTSANIKVGLVSSAYSPSQSADQFLSTVGAALLVSTANLTSVVVSSGIFGAANAVFTSVPTAVTAVGMVVYVDSGSPSTSPLLLYLDSTYYSGLPLALNGGNVNLSFSPTGNLIAAV